ncbi:hypothetical protein P5V15_001217 [Pogonomyrmex californicus]
MKFVRQPLTIRVANCDERARMMGDIATERKHGEMLPSTIRAIICGPSNCGKTNVLISLLESPHGVRFENVRIFEIAATTEISILGKFTNIDRRNRLLYVLQQQ